MLCLDDKLRAELEKMRREGVELLACKACADRYGLSDEFRNLGVNVTYMGQPLSVLGHM